MNLYDLGHVPWLDSQLIYHALPRLDIPQSEALILLAPAEPYACIGYHQDAEQEIDLSYCREQAIPVFRREVGGGAVFLDGQQLFYQLIIHKDNPLVPRDKSAFYAKFLAPVVQAYRDLGVEARYRPINDIVTTDGIKISGNGAADIGDYAILVGNLIADFDYATMVRVLRVPDAKFRDKVFKSLRENLTTLRRELGHVPDWAAMTDALVRNFETVLGPLSPAALPQAVLEQVAALVPTFTSNEWLLKPGKRFAAGRDVKIASGLHVMQRVHKAPGGLIRATAETHEGQLRSVELSGDFFIYPAGALAELEQYLIGAELPEIEGAVEEFYRAKGIESPGVAPYDFAVALGAADPRL
jgi:lipoate-protein ligase A